MSPEDRSLLERTYKMTEENNDILKSIRRTTRFSLALKIFYWVLIIGLSIGAFYFIQPYIEFMTGMLGINGNTSGPANSSQNYLNTLEDLLK